MLIMPKLLRTVLSIVLGLVAGSIVNMGLILISGKVIPPPIGADVTTMDGLKASLYLFEPKHFLFPFLAHAIGTLAGASIAVLIAPDKSRVVGYVIGGLFLFGGIANVFLLLGPVWFNTLDILLAYLPAAWLGQVIAPYACAVAE